MAEDDAVFTSRLMAFYLSDMSAEIRRFCTARCEPFVEAEEHKLEYTEVFHEFEALVESLLARFVAREYSTAEGAAYADSRTYVLLRIRLARPLVARPRAALAATRC